MNSIEVSEWFKNQYEELEKDPKYHAIGIMMEISEFIYRERIKKKLKQKDMIKYFGSKRRWQAINQGNENLTIQSICDIALHFGYVPEIVFHKKRKNK